MPIFIKSHLTGKLSDDKPTRLHNLRRVFPSFRHCIRHRVKDMERLGCEMHAGKTRKRN